MRNPHPAISDASDLSEPTVLATTQRWLERAVIGLGLCPFAKAVHAHRQIRWVVSAANDPETLLDELRRELRLLADADPEAIDTTLLIHPLVLQDFLDFNDFLEVAEGAVSELELDGELQVASFHPQFQFADAPQGDISHASNQSPYPTLHLLREASIDRAVAAFPEAEAIFERNIETLRRLGPAGWRALFVADATGS
jgi:uncharacterized protein